MFDIDSLNKRVASERKAAAWARTILIIVNVVVGGFIFFWVMESITSNHLLPGSIVTVALLFFIVFGLSLFIYNSIKSKYVTKVKDIIYEEVFKVQFQNTLFDPKGGISIQTLRENKIVETADKQYTNDFLSGTYEGVAFERCDVHTQSSSTDSDGNTTYTTVFRGQVYAFNFNKNHTSHIRVMEKGFLNSFKIFNRNAIELENSEFNSLFSVTSSNAHDVFYVFTPHFMDKYINLHRRLDGKTCLVLVDGRLYLAINNNRDSFEPTLGELGHSFQSSLEQDINIIKTIIHDLDLTNTLFKPE